MKLKVGDSVYVPSRRRSARINSIEFDQTWGPQIQVKFFSNDWGEELTWLKHDDRIVKNYKGNKSKGDKYAPHS